MIARGNPRRIAVEFSRTPAATHGNPWDCRDRPWQPMAMPWHCHRRPWPSMVTHGIATIARGNPWSLMGLS